MLKNELYKHKAEKIKKMMPFRPTVRNKSIESSNIALLTQDSLNLYFRNVVLKKAEVVYEA